MPRRHYARGDTMPRDNMPRQHYARVDDMPRGTLFQVGQPCWYTFHMVPYPHMNILIRVHSGLVYIQSVPFGTL